MGTDLYLCCYIWYEKSLELGFCKAWDGYLEAGSGLPWLLAKESHSRLPLMLLEASQRLSSTSASRGEGQIDLSSVGHMTGTRSVILF